MDHKHYFVMTHRGSLRVNATHQCGVARRIGRQKWPGKIQAADLTEFVGPPQAGPMRVSAAAAALALHFEQADAGGD
jgi:hypothetical protein